MFNFKMQTVLDVRQAIADKITAELSEQQIKLKQEQDQLDMIRQQKTDLVGALRSMQDKAIPVADIIMNKACFTKHRQEEVRQQEKVDILTGNVELKRDELIEAQKKKEAMEICKTKHFEEYRHEEKRVERSALDEMVIARQNRREHK